MSGEPHDVTTFPPEEAPLQPIECEVRLASRVSLDASGKRKVLCPCQKLNHNLFVVQSAA